MVLGMEARNWKKLRVCGNGGLDHGHGMEQRLKGCEGEDECDRKKERYTGQ